MKPEKVKAGKIKNFARQLQNDFPESCLLDQMIGPLTHYQVGGIVDAMVIPLDLKQLAQIYRQCLREDIPCFVLGKGANILVCDQGFQGVIFLLDKCCNQLSHEQELLYVGAGVTVKKLVEYCEKNGLAGLDFMSGIPGTVGGALTMNAGAFVGEIGDRVIKVDALDEKGLHIEIPVENAKFGYRRADGLKGKLLLGCSLDMHKGEQLILEEARKNYLHRRAEKQPLEYPSCGSVFKRPPGDYAGRLIEAARAKGTTIGGAMVSHKHANFIVNFNNATAQDIYQVICQVQKKVYQHFKVWLQLEVKLIGFSPEDTKRVENPRCH